MCRSLNYDGLKEDGLNYKTLGKFLKWNESQLIKTPMGITDSTQSQLDVILLVSSKTELYLPITYPFT